MWVEPFSGGYDTTGRRHVAAGVMLPSLSIRSKVGEGITITIRRAGSGRVLIVTTPTTLGAEPAQVWPLLTDSRMDRAPRCPVFAVGTPRPVACSLPDGVGGVGAQRECRATEGVVRQRITRWEPGEVLEFRMEQTDLRFASWVAGIDERFELACRADGRTRLTRTTTVTMQGTFPTLTAVVMSVGLKAVHRHVFGSWRRQCGSAAHRQAAAIGRAPE